MIDEEQECLASESAKAIADNEAMIEMEHQRELAEQNELLLTLSPKRFIRKITSAHNTEEEWFEKGKQVQLEQDKAQLAKVHKHKEALLISKGNEHPEERIPLYKHKLDRLPIGQRVLVKELNVAGTIYESAMPGQLSSGVERVYGIKLDNVTLPKNFCATKEWHCPLEGLEILEHRLDRPELPSYCMECPFCQYEYSSGRLSDTGTSSTWWSCKKTNERIIEKWHKPPLSCPLRAEAGLDREKIANIVLEYDKQVKQFMANAQCGNGNIKHPSISEVINEILALFDKEEIRKQEMDRMLFSLRLLLEKGFNLKDAISALEDSIEKLHAINIGHYSDIQLAKAEAKREERESIYKILCVKCQATLDGLVK